MRAARRWPLVAAQAHRLAPAAARARRGSCASVELGGRHGLEVGLLQALAVGEGEAGRRTGARPRASRRPGLAARGAPAWRQRLGQAVGCAAAAASSPRPLDLAAAAAYISCSSSFGSRQKASKAASKTACCSWRSSITADERGVHVVAPIEADRLDRGDRREHAVGADRQAGRAQHAREVDDVVGDQARPAPRRSLRLDASSRMRLGAQLVEQPCACRRLSHAGDVVLVLEQHAERVVHRCRVEATSRSSATSALVQSMVSATPGALKRSSVRMRCTNSTTWRRQPLGRRRAPCSRTISSSRSTSGNSTQW